MNKDLVDKLHKQVEQGDIVKAYRIILGFMGRLRGVFTAGLPDCKIGAIYQGVLDMSYFPVFSEKLAAKGLKLAVVYEYRKNAFEVWLSARNRDRAKQVSGQFQLGQFSGIEIFHEAKNADAILECTLAAAPCFDDMDALEIRLLEITTKFLYQVESII